jgi:hypothetical protein
VRRSQSSPRIARKRLSGIYETGSSTECHSPHSQQLPMLFSYCSSLRQSAASPRVWKPSSKMPRQRTTPHPRRDPVPPDGLTARGLCLSKSQSRSFDSPDVNSVQASVCNLCSRRTSRSPRLGDVSGVGVAARLQAASTLLIVDSSSSVFEKPDYGRDVSALTGFLRSTW